MTAIEVTKFFAGLSYDRDDREPPDNLRNGRFRAGWGDAVDRLRQYQEDTLTILTWSNLGFRFGQRFGPTPSEEMDEIYAILASLYASCREASVSTPGEVPEQLVEGAVSRIVVNAYERNREARDRCVAVYGSSCCVCGVDFGQKYGPLAAGFIHVHHLKPLSAIAKGYIVDPERDLRPVCPNCHAVIHLGRPEPFTIEQVIEFIAVKHASRPT